MPTIRLLPYEIADGPTNMAADEALLLSAADGVASLRFYGWSPATLSLGYFQPAAARSQWPNVPWVRRATGGALLAHDQELTYALALPAGLPWQTGEPWMARFHEIIRAALASLGFDDSSTLAAVAECRGEVLCFQRHTVGDLLSRPAASRQPGGLARKIGGSAQRKHRRSLLQHGSILLRQSSLTPELPGLRELTGVDLSAEALRGAIVGQFVAATAWPVEPGVWTAGERRLIEELVREKFGHASWNDKR